MGGKAFSNQAPLLLTHLPVSVRKAGTLSVFKARLLWSCSAPTFISIITGIIIIIIIMIVVVVVVVAFFFYSFVYLLHF